MDEKKLEKLNKLLELVQNDTVSPKDIEKFLMVVLDFIKQSKNSFETISAENLKTINESIAYIEQIKEKTEQSIDVKGTEFKTKLDGKISELEGLIKEVKSLPPLEKVIEKTEVIREVPIVTNEIKEVAVTDTAEDIVDKINTLSISEENQIDASHIKNLPEFIGKGGGSTARNTWQLNDVSKTRPTNGQTLVYNNTTKQYEPATSGGTPGGALTSIQYNNAGAFDGFGTWDGSLFTVGGDLSAANVFATLGLSLGAVNTEIKSSTLGVWTVVGSTGNEANIDANSLTLDRTFTLPDATGTIALTSDLSSYVPYTGATGAVNLGANNFTVDTNVLFVNATNNRVGIGTITPSSQLTIKGATDATFEVAGSTAGRRGLFTYNNAPAVFELDVDTNFRLKTGSSYAMFATNGQVIIGSVGTPIGTLRVPIAPTASANYGVVNLGSGAFDGATAGFFTGNAQGTVLAVNSASGTANLIDLQLAGAKRFAVLSTGFVRIGTGLNSGIDPQGNTGYMFYNSTAPTTGTSAYGFFGRKVTATTGTVTHMDLMGDIVSSNGTGFAAGAGSANWRGVSAIYEINNSGVQSGTATGIFLNATETALNSMTHNLMDLQVGGVSKFKVTNAGALTVASDLTVDTNTLFVDATNNRVGIGTASPSGTFHVTVDGTSNTLPDNIFRLETTTSNNYGPAMRFKANTASDFYLAATGTLNTAGAGYFQIYDGTLSGLALKINKNNIVTGSEIIRIAGETSSYPALKRSTTGIIARLADDSADTWFQAKYFYGSANNALTATGTTRADALQLSNQVNNLTTVASGTGVILPTGSVGMRITIFNNGANVAKIYANGSETIDGVAGSTGVNLTNAVVCDYFFTATNTWISAQLGAPSA